MRRTALFLILVLVAIVAFPAIAAEDGKALFEQKCGMCHGKDGVAKPAGKGSRNFNDPEYQKAVTVEEIAKITEDGKNKMPGYKSKLTAEQIQAIAAHVKTLGK
jgi:cytochrome c6